MDDDAINLYLKEHVSVGKVKNGSAKELMVQEGQDKSDSQIGEDQNN